MEKQQKVQDAKIRPIYGNGEKMLQYNSEDRKWVLLSEKDFHNMQIGKDSAWYKRAIYILYLCVPSTILEVS